MRQMVPKTTRVLLATLAGSLALLAFGVGSAAAAHEASQQPTSNCWKQVINDWENNGRIDSVYAPPCYTQAIQHLNAYPDIKGYSNVIQDIQAALYAVLHEEGRGGGSGPAGPTGSSSGPSSPSSPSIPTKGNGGPVKWLDTHLAPGNAQSVPLPLLVLGGLALLLLLAAAATWFARRIQSNRMKPRPAPQPRRST
jgi:hypothetical protein